MYRDTAETMHISLIGILLDNISDQRSIVSDPYYPFGEIYSDALLEQHWKQFQIFEIVSIVSNLFIIIF